MELLTDRLPVFLKRDFVTLLPPELVCAILRFLPTRDVFRCLRVSRGWRDVVTNCRSYWKSYALSLGVSPSALPGLLERYVSCKAVAVALLQTRKQLQYGRAVFQDYSNKLSLQPPTATLTCRPAQPVWNRLFICHGGYASSDMGTYIISICCLDQSDSLVELARTKVPYFFTILWSHASHKHVVIHGSDGSWLQTRIICRDTCDTCSTVWRDSVYSMAYYELGCCPECSLIVIINRVAREKRWWDLLVVRLVDGEEEAHKLFTSFPFLPVESHHNSIFFQIHKLAVNTHSSDHDSVGFCSRHKLLIQFGATICIFSLHIKPNGDPGFGDILAVESLSTLCPFNDQSYFFTASVLGHKFCLSSDERFASYLVDGDLFTWNLETLELCQKRSKASKLPTNSDVIAVGSAFSIIVSTSRMQTLQVISTISGETLVNYYIGYVGDDPMFGPMDQSWLNSISVLERSVPLAITIRKWYSPGVWLLKVAKPF